MLDRCPGSLRGAPTLKLKKCPECGGEVEVFSNDVKVNCECGFTVYNDIESCVQWCKYARLCVGEQLYKKLKRTRIAFVGVENTARSIMAEALAKEINTSPMLGFVSAGISPGGAADPAAVEAMAAQNIVLRGKPKDVMRVGLADIYVLMGPEVYLPEDLEKKARVIRWDIPDPGEKGAEEYQRVIEMLKEKISNIIEEAGEDD
ncbi:MAG: low molecular weight phosphatase family protein [Bacillota bacterium]